MLDRGRCGFSRPWLERLELRLVPAAHNTLTTASLLTFDATTQQAQVSATLADANQVDLYAVQLQLGAQVFADAVPASSGGPTIALRIFDANGRQLSSQVGTAGQDTFQSFDALAAGTYYIGVSSNGNLAYDPTRTDSGGGGSTSGDYTLTLNLGSFLINEGSSNFQLGTAQAVAGDQGFNTIDGNMVLHGTYVAGKSEYYAFAVANGETGSLIATVTPTDPSVFLPRFSLYNDIGQLLIQTDATSAGQPSARLAQNLRPGLYFLGVSAATSFDNPDGDHGYLLETTFNQVLPPFQVMSVGSEPHSLAVGDFNHDGHLDLVTANQGDGTLSVLLGNGDGTFQSPNSGSFTVGNDPVAVAVGDFNNDGSLDLVAANHDDNTVSVLLGNGDGTFQNAVTFNVGKNPDSVAVGSFTPGGPLDIVIANAGENTVSVLLGNGDGTFQNAVSYPVGNDPAAVAVGEINGQIDIVTANAGDNTVSVLQGQGGTFLPAVSYGVGKSPDAVALGDVEHDGRLDIVTANAGSNSVTILQGQADGTFRLSATESVGIHPYSVAVGDLQNMGRLSIVTANYDNTVSVLQGNGDGTFQKAAFYKVLGSVPEAVAVGDFTGSGHLDIATANHHDDSVSLLMGRGDGTFEAPPTYNVGGFPDSVATGDFKRDGNLDLVTANNGDGTVSVLIGNGDGTFQNAVSYPAGSVPYAVAVGAFTHDGNLDLVTANQGDSTVSVLLGRGDGTFLPPVTYPLPAGSQPRSVAVGDFTGDGNLDIVTSDTGTNSVSVLLGHGDGTFSPAVTYAVGKIPEGLVVGDFTGDGHLDIATANFGDDTVSVLLGDGHGSFQPAVAYTVGSGPVGVILGDFGNGQLDLATANYNDGTVSVLLGQGNGTFQLSPTTYNVGTHPYNIAAGDFSHDGHLDLVVPNQGDNTVSVLAGKGDATFLPADTYTVGNFPDHVQVADFNNDGNLDLATANAGDNTVSVLLGSGHGPFLTAVPYAAGQHPAAVTSGDFNNDSIPDLATANAADNTVSVLTGKGDGTFRTPVSYGVGNDPVAITTVSDNSGNLDIVTANAKDNTVSLLVGNGDGTFQPAVPLSVGTDPVAVGSDFDANGNTWIVTANAGDNTVSLIEQNSDGSFQPAISLPVGNNPQSLNVTTDTNGNLLIITANAGDDTVSVIDQSSDGSFPAAVTYSVGHDPSAVATGYDANFNLDIATANAGDNTVSLLVGNSDGTYQNAIALDVGNDPVAVAMGNDANSNLDIVTANAADNTVSVLRQNSGGTFAPAVAHAVGQNPTSVLTTDLKNNGNLDIVTANAGDGTVSVILGNAPFQTSTPSNGIAIRNVPYLRDLNRDGVPDALVLDSSGEILYRRGLAGAPDQFAPPVVINPGHPARDATVYRTAQGWAVAAIDKGQNSLSLYTWDGSQNTFDRTAAFSTGDLPVRVAAADLTGNGLDDLVVANAFDHSLTIAFQQPSGQFSTVTRAVGMGPSDIAFANLGGSAGLAIVVSDQVSGDFSILFNDATHSFSQQSRYRAGAGLFGIDDSTGEQSIVSQLGSNGIAAGDFTGSSSDSLVLLNRGAQSFTLFANLGQGNFGDPQAASTYLTGDQPGEVACLTLPGDQRPSVAVLMRDLNQIWLYRNNGDGTFAAPVKIDAGNSPTGFSVTLRNGQPELLVGNEYGDILTLLYNGQGSFVPDRATLQNVPLAVGTLAATGQQFVVVADQKLDQVTLYYRIPGTKQLGRPILVNGTAELPLLAPGAVQTFTVHGDPNPYLVVANSLSNDVLVYHFDSLSGGFDLLGKYTVGDDPVAVTVADLNGDGIPDLLVANQGSNDISVLIGQATTPWSSTPYQRLKSGGSGPIAVAVRSSSSGHGPDLLATNSDGTISVLTGIGSGGKGSGFFQDSNPQTFHLGQPIVQSLTDPTNGQLYVVGADGSVNVLSGNGFASVFGGGVSTLGTFGADLVAGLRDGIVALMSEDGTVLATAPTGFLSQPVALDVLGRLQGLDVFVTERGSDVPAIVSFSFGPLEANLAPGTSFLLEVGAAIPVVTNLPGGPAVAEGANLPGLELVLVATLLSGDLVEGPTQGPVGAATEASFAVFVPPAVEGGGVVDQIRHRDGGEVIDRAPPRQPEPARSWESYPQGAGEALQRRLRSQQVREVMEDVLEAVRGTAERLGGVLRQLTPPPEKTEMPPGAVPDQEAREQPAEPEARGDGFAEAAEVPSEPGLDVRPALLSAWLAWCLGAELLPAADGRGRRPGRRPAP
jgi:hypothetical protein